LRKRTALNFSIAGTAADLIKLAMIAIAKRLKKEKLKAQMILAGARRIGVRGAAKGKRRCWKTWCA